jgi:ubiquinone/menaquinone biosynthesis C-methylase UbiE
VVRPAGVQEQERTRRYYDAFAATYEDRRDGRSRYHDLLDDLEVELAAPWARGARLLEVGCGTGLILRRLGEYAAHAVGVDLSPGMLARARARGLDVREGSATALPFADASFDVAVSFKTLAHVPDLPRALAEMARVVRPGGVLIAELYNPRSLRRLAKRWLPAGRVARGTERDVYVRFDDRSALEAALPRGCRIVHARGIRTLVPAAAILELPMVGGAFARLERRVADARLGAELGGFVAWVLSRG